MPNENTKIGAFEGIYHEPDILPFNNEPFRQSMRGLLEPGTRAAYMFAGQAIITAKSLSTGVRFTYKINQAGPGRPLWFVGLLSGPDNTADYRYLGTVRKRPGGFEFALTAKSRATGESAAVRAIAWLVRSPEDSRAEVWHEGRCGRCGRVLTVPESIASGIGPTCRSRE